MRKLKYFGVLCALLLLAVLLGAYLCLRGSLPQLDGQLRQPELAAAVRITRDARGVPTIEAANRADLAFATGFLHAQDRFFEMDLSRRLAAGELAELFGPVALEQDRKARLFRFRSIARQVISQASPEQRAVIEAYTRGVNAGLARLRARPWEYWVLGQRPAAWRTEDAMLVAYAMWWDLQINGFRREILRLQINARLGGALCEGGWKCAMQFLYPRTTAWDAPDAVTPEPPAAEAPVPGAEVLDVRAAPAPSAAAAPFVRAMEAGSNNWAVAGRLTASGAALIANDMHLNQRVPTIWYHARLKVSGADPASQLDLNGVTLPGTPLLVAGSNGRIAWGFTNSYGDWLAVEREECSAVDAQGMHTPGGTVPLEVVREEIAVHGAAAAVELVHSGPRGLLVRIDAATHSCWFGAWLAQRPDATNMNLMKLEQVSSVDEALALAPQMGMPEQNLVVGDREGHIGWTIFGRIPADTGPQRARAAGAWTTAREHPHIIDPPAGRLWTANARVASDPRQLELIGGHVASLGSGYDLGARAGQIRDALMALPGNIKPADMLSIQLDDRARFLARWQSLLLSLLDEKSVQGEPRRAQLRALLAGWNGHASVDSVAYRLVRAYHDRVQEAVWDAILAALAVQGDAEVGPPAQFEGPLWQLLTSQPLHMLPHPYDSWPQFLRAQADATLAELAPSCPELARCTWGARNLVRIRHPLSRALPRLAGLLDMPTLQLPGDHDMPRVQDGAFGASERFAVSPGHEEEAYLELPGGESGHPLSPYYRSDFLGWAHGEALPLLPGASEHTLTLTPN
jgi:penicillin G amidase